ncbi:MAG TPA: OsmC family protein [Candidatus Dormibacteraeota bacterium]|nr:OsmC family protein [Candidatus Dormibacteraeota bacterium]
MAASARWSGEGLRFDLSDDQSHITLADEAPPLGAGRGMSPSDLLLAALCACTGITAVSLLKKMKQPMRALTVKADGDRQSDWPKAFTKIRLTFEISGDGPFDDALVRKATRLATKRYCAVGGTIELGQGGCEIVFDHRILNDNGI